MSADQRQLLERYVAAFENYDMTALVKLFTADVVWEMPPFSGWFEGPAAIAALNKAHCPASGPGDMVLLPAQANGGPAFGLYMRGDDGVHRAFQLHVVHLRGPAIDHVVAFFDTSLFGLFGLPDVLPARGMTEPRPAATLSGGVALLERAVGYTLGQLHAVTTADLSRPTPCACWDLRELLEHMDDSLAAVTEALNVGHSMPPGPGYGPAGSAVFAHRHAARPVSRLLGALAQPGRRAGLGGRLPGPGGRRDEHGSGGRSGARLGRRPRLRPRPADPRPAGRGHAGDLAAAGHRGRPAGSVRGAGRRRSR